MKTLLLPTDFSENAKKATDFAISLYGDEQSYFILLNSYERPRTGQSMMKSIVDILRNDSKRGLKKEYKRLNQKFNQENMDIEFLSENGELINSINSALKKHQLDMIFVGSKGENELEEIILGSNTARIIKNIDAPIMVIPATAEFQKPNKIVFASDLKEITNDEILKPLLEIAKKYDAEVMILHVEKGNNIDRMTAEANLKEYLKEVKHSFHYVENTDIPKGIEAFLERQHVDYLSVIKRKGTLIENIFHQSLTKKIALSAKHPLLVMHDKK